MTTIKPQLKIVDCSTGEEIIKDATAEQIKQYKIEAEQTIALQADAETKAAARQAIAERLGLTADELAVLLG